MFAKLKKMCIRNIHKFDNIFANSKVYAIIKDVHEFKKISRINRKSVDLKKLLELKSSLTRRKSWIWNKILHLLKCHVIRMIMNFKKFVVLKFVLGLKIWEPTQEFTICSLILNVFEYEKTEKWFLKMKILKSTKKKTENK